MTTPDAATTLATHAGTTWAIDPAHSEATFAVRHAGLAKVRGTVPITAGSVTLGQSLADTRVSATLDPSGITTGNGGRDEHLRSADFFEVETYPTWTFTSTDIKEGASGELTMTGDLAIHGVTKPVTLAVEFAGTAVANGQERAGFSATGEISRKDFGLTWNAPIEAGGLLVGDQIKLELEIAAVKED